MKGLELTSSAKHLLVIEDKDRLVILGKNDVAIVLSDEVEEIEGDADKDIKIAVHFPTDVDQDAPTPRPIVLAACIRVFLDNTEWVRAAEQVLAKETSTKKEVTPITAPAPNEGG